ncbi:MAG TPA: S-layer homology domain-containing protein, partial [Clostridia bacterium]|nr:S-layer homology domain-containing protein [Clostridia bacterium]
HGTSFAAPHVAGIAALALAIQPDLTASDFMDLARVTSRDLGPVGYDREYGHGLIDAQALLASLKSSFPDVPYASWYFGYVANLARRSIINGYPDGTFKPNRQVRRDHAAKMIANAAGLDSRGKKASFTDLGPEHEMSAFIAALVDKGAIRGYPDGSYRPDRPIIREHVCQIVAKAFDLERGDLPLAFNDLSGQAEADSYIEILASNGIVKGTGQGRFQPGSEVTRAELSKILSVAMAVSAIQEAEREVSISAFDRAQLLINALPQDQDLVMREYLQTRLSAVRP